MTDSRKNDSVQNNRLFDSTASMVVVCIPVFREPGIGQLLDNLAECVRFASLDETAPKIAVVCATCSEDTESANHIRLWRHKSNVSWLTVTIESQRGIGRARHTASLRALELVEQAGVDPSRAWILCSDADCRYSRDYLRTWVRCLSEPVLSAGTAVAAGTVQYNPSLSRFLSPEWVTFAAGLTVLRRRFERSFGLVNTFGQNMAIRCSAYGELDGFDQPIESSIEGHSILLPGEDWRLGARTLFRHLGLQRVPSLVTTSPRRFVADPSAYVTHRAYMKDYQSAPDLLQRSIEAPSLSTKVSALFVTMVNWAAKPALFWKSSRDEVMRRTSFSAEVLASFAGMLSGERVSDVGKGDFAHYCRTFGEVMCPWWRDSDWFYTLSLERCVGLADRVD